MYKVLLAVIMTLTTSEAPAWGFFAHRRITQYAVYLLPPELIAFYKPHLAVLVAHSVDPDARRYLLKEEGPRHYIDLDRYGPFPFEGLPRRWDSALARYGEDSLNARGIVPWWVQRMHYRLIAAFRERNSARILQLSSEIGHYIADAHVPLHTHSNHDGQHTGQKGIHGFWESRAPELLCEPGWDFLLPRAAYIPSVLPFVWDRVLQSAAAADSVLAFERALSARTPPDRKFAFETRNGVVVRQYSRAYTLEYDRLLGGMIERRMRASVWAVASLWYTAWMEAGQPALTPPSPGPS